LKNYDSKYAVIKLDKVGLVGNKCDIAANIFPISQWKQIEFRAAHLTHEKNCNAPLGELGTFERAVAMDDIGYELVAWRATDMLIKNDEAQSPVMLKNDCFKWLTESDNAQGKVLLDACDGCRSS
jgi:hypothetical protein